MGAMGHLQGPGAVPAVGRRAHLEDGVHDDRERAVPRVLGHFEHVKAPLVRVFEFLEDMEAADEPGPGGSGEGSGGLGT